MSDLPKKAWQTLRQEGLGAAIGKCRSLVSRHRYDRDYRDWIEKYERLTADEVEAVRAKIDELPRKPLISVLMPVYNVDARWLRSAIDSVREQIYTNWELCIADDHSSKPHIREILDDFSKKDPRIKVVYRTDNGHISAASNSALEIVTGDLTALMDHDDLLAPLALYFVAKEINEFPDAAIFYSDEDKISVDGRRFAPTFKSDWAPDLMNSFNLFTHLIVYRTSSIKACGFRSEFDGSQDYDLALRAIDKVAAENIRHIPRILYHWRAVPGSVALDADEKSYAHDRARWAITENLRNKGIAGTAERGISETHRIKYALPDPKPMVSIVVVDVNSDLGDLRQTLSNELGDYPHEIILVTDSEDERFSDKTIQIPRSGHGILADMNAGAAAAIGSVLLFLDDTTVAASRDSFIEMIGLAIQPETGSVGAKVLYPDKTVKFAGFVIGYRGGIGRVHHNLPSSRLGHSYRLAVIQNVSAVSAGGLMIRRSVFESVGGFGSDSLPNNYGDIDLCCRLLQHGYRNIWTPWAEIVQAGKPNPEAIAELEQLKLRCPDIFKNDPYYNPNLSLETEDLALARPPRLDKY